RHYSDGVGHLLSAVDVPPSHVEERDHGEKDHAGDGNGDQDFDQAVAALPYVHRCSIPQRAKTRPLGERSIVYCGLFTFMSVLSTTEAVVFPEGMATRPSG